MLILWRASRQTITYCLSSHHNNANGCFYVAVQVHGYVEFANVTDGAVRHRRWQ
jgi:hypothetical protein